MEQLIYELNGIRYLLIEAVISGKPKEDVIKKFAEHNCIYQGVKEIKQDGWWTSGYMILKILVPETEIDNVNKIEL